MCACCTKRQSEAEAEEGFFTTLFGSPQTNGAACGAGGTPGSGPSGPATGSRGRFAGATPSGILRHDEEVSATTVRRHTLDVSGERSLLLYSVSDLLAKSRVPVVGRGVSADRCVQQALHVPPNTTEAVPIETECFVGKSMVIYRTPPGSARASQYGPYFGRRKRNWEVRVQGRFKRIPKGDMFIGIILRDFNYDQSVATHSKIVKNAGMALVKSYDLYFSWGDRCGDALKKDAELSHLVTGMSGWDQVICTPSGSTPPDLGCDLGEIGDSHGLNYERAKMGLKNYSEAADETFRNISLEDTYTLCFWGVSQVIDLLGWQFKIGTHISMARFFEESPLHVAMYEIERPANGKKHDRHLESMKHYYLDFMFWSNAVSTPSLPSRYIFADAPPGIAQSSGAFPARELQRDHSDGHRSDGSQRRGTSPTSSTGSSTSGGQGSAQSILAAWGQRLRWIPQRACSNGARRASRGSGLEAAPR